MTATYEPATYDHVTTSGWTRPVTMDREGHIRIPRAGAITAALLRITLGLLYLWAFVAQGLGVGYTNTDPPNPAAGAVVTYGWHFTYDADDGWITSGFSHSPTAPYVDRTHGPTAWLVQDLPTGVDDIGWMFAIGGLALTLGICSRIAGWGGMLLNLLIWFAGFPPSSNPVIDGTHTVYALLLLLLMWVQASNYWGIGRWWRERTPALLH